MSEHLPVLFLGHGSPMTTITDAPERRSWQALGRALPRPRAILAITAHWETRGATHLTTEDRPKTIHDFRGFPQELFDVRYPAPGSPETVDRVTALIGYDRVVRDETWGYDHGAWGVILPMYPEADVPLVAMSLDRTLSPRQHFELGERLAPLRDEGVLIVASGNVIHNLGLWRQSAGMQLDWRCASGIASTGLWLSATSKPCSTSIARTRCWRQTARSTTCRCSRREGERSSCSTIQSTARCR